MAVPDHAEKGQKYFIRVVEATRAEAYDFRNSPLDRTTPNCCSAVELRELLYLSAWGWAVQRLIILFGSRNYSKPS